MRDPTSICWKVHLVTNRTSDRLLPGLANIRIAQKVGYDVFMKRWS